MKEKQQSEEEISRSIELDIAVDLDGVIASYDGWKGYEIIGEPNPGVKEFLETLKQRGYGIVIYSCRERYLIERYMHKYKLPYDRIVSGSKPPAFAYIDDRAITFRGNFDRTLEEIIDFRAWWESDNQPVRRELTDRDLVELLIDFMQSNMLGPSDKSKYLEAVRRVNRDTLLKWLNGADITKVKIDR